MRIAIFGSFKENDDYILEGDKSSFEQACYQLGMRLVKDGHKIIVASPAEDTADFHVVRGAFDFLKDKESKSEYIEILRPISAYRPFLNYYSTNPTIFNYHIFEQKHWQGSQLMSVEQSDIIITIGGGRSTYNAGLAAIFFGKKVYPIGSFGGASRELLKQLVKDNSDSHKKLILLNNPWVNSLIDKLIEVSEINSPPKILIIHGRSKDYIILKNYLITQLQIPPENVIVMAETNAFGETLPEKFEALARTVNCAIALATPDDYGFYKLTGEDLAGNRARQNVWLEVGWFWGKLGRNKVMVLCKGKIEMPSDYLGIEYFEYEKSPIENLKIEDFVKGIDRR